MSSEAVTAKARPRDAMPNVARWVDEKRAAWGREHVRECIERGMRGEPGWFFAFEAGYVQGTPFEADKVTMDLVRLAVAVNGKFVALMRPPKPEEATDGAH